MGNKKFREIFLSIKNDEFYGTTLNLCNCEVNAEDFNQLLILIKEKNLFIKDLILSDTEIEKLHIQSKDFSSLQYLVISNNAKLKDIKLNGVFFKLFTLNINNCKCLNNLELCGNSFPDLRNLKVFENKELLNFNVINKLPYYLEEFFLYKNKISSIHLIADNPSKLRTIKFHNNQLKKITFEGNFNHLTNIVLSNNQLEVVDLSCKNFSGLQELDLSNNKIKELILRGNFFSLRGLIISDNNIEKLEFNGKYPSLTNFKITSFSPLTKMSENVNIGNINWLYDTFPNLSEIYWQGGIRDTNEYKAKILYKTIISSHKKSLMQYDVKSLLMGHVQPLFAKDIKQILNENEFIFANLQKDILMQNNSVLQNIANKYNPNARIFFESILCCLEKAFFENAYILQLKIRDLSINNDKNIWNSFEGFEEKVKEKFKDKIKFLFTNIYDQNNQSKIADLLINIYSDRMHNKDKNPNNITEQLKQHMYYKIFFYSMVQFQSFLHKKIPYKYYYHGVSSLDLLDHNKLDNRKRVTVSSYSLEHNIVNENNLAQIHEAISEYINAILLINDIPDVKFETNDLSEPIRLALFIQEKTKLSQGIDKNLLKKFLIIFEEYVKYCKQLFSVNKINYALCNGNLKYKEPNFFCNEKESNLKNNKMLFLYRDKIEHDDLFAKETILKPLDVIKVKEILLKVHTEGYEFVFDDEKNENILIQNNMALNYIEKTYDENTRKNFKYFLHCFENAVFETNYFLQHLIMQNTSEFQENKNFDEYVIQQFTQKIKSKFTANINNLLLKIYNPTDLLEICDILMNTIFHSKNQNTSVLNSNNQESTQNMIHKN